MISGTAGSTSFFLKKSCLETKRFSRHAWQVNDVVHPKTVEGRKDLQSFSKHSRTPITRVTMRPVSGLAILSLNPSLQMKLIDDYAAGNTDAHKSPVDERYRLISPTINFRIKIPVKPLRPIGLAVTVAKRGPRICQPGVTPRYEKNLP